ncbi:hypothetical protein AXX16_4262 [Serratia rubidaea]|nr:hypothetical protein AXX16_4262 [Serratia rubidaea]
MCVFKSFLSYVSHDILFVFIIVFIWFFVFICLFYIAVIFYLQ